MTLASHIHPLLVHFPIGLVLIAAFFEAVAIGTGLERWHTVAVANVQAGAALAVLTAITGWLLAKSMARPRSAPSDMASVARDDRGRRCA
jgi:uncharacterized membrane protein